MRTLWWAIFVNKPSENIIIGFTQNKKDFENDLRNIKNLLPVLSSENIDEMRSHLSSLITEYDDYYSKDILKMRLALKKRGHGILVGR